MNNVELFDFISNVYNSKLDIIKSNTKIMKYKNYIQLLMNCVKKEMKTYIKL